MPETIRTVRPTPHDLHRRLVPRQVTQAARRRLLLEMRRCGISAEQIAEWSHASWWPTLRDAPEVLAVRKHLEAFMGPGDVWAETQILIRLPDEEDTVLGPPHVDDQPPWAEEHGLRYKRILSVELTDTAEGGGGTVIHWPDRLEPVHQKEGDVLSMRPDIPHSGSPNFSPDPRIALFFRLLEPVE